MRLFPLPFLLLAACGSDAQPDRATTVPPPPAELCEQSRKGLDALGSKGAIDYDDKGEATMPQDAWMSMSAERHNQFARMLAIHAACARPDGAAERQVRIRNEMGTILLENMVPTVIDLGRED
jgi:hypothetical protein